MVSQSENPKAVESVPEKQPSQQSTEESTSQERMISETEYKKLLADAVNAAKGEEGRKHKVALAAAEKRVRDDLQSSLSKIQDENRELQEVIDDMAKDDEDKTRLAQLLRDNKKKADDLENKVKTYEPKIAKAEEYELTEQVNQVVNEFDSADAARLRRQVARTKFNDNEDRLDQIREIAEDFGWERKSGIPVIPPVVEQPRKVDSDVSSGKRALTAADVAKMTPDEKNKRMKEIAAIPFG